MKLIMTHEVTGLGAPGDVVEVRDGYGRNYLLPRGLAVKWTRGGQKQVDQIKRARQARDIRGLDEAKEIAEQLGGMNVRLTQRAGHGGRLFGSVTSSKVAEAVKEAGGPEIDKRRVEIRNPIKSVGEHQVTVRLHPEVSATVSLEVVGS
ncbi:50S ribosomal protein L9 [Halostreptopolyspora alba]|uniref:Large ribosomal subunit protein bL9 n=1 Tax=Halostreptopolyspora alba TaxID=2487137 RepID=A0A3N0E5S7_9ACTN|nr:50S ribosomal protein L9 [Nocardiopsaceae bacterium YIM 96095]